MIEPLIKKTIRIHAALPDRIRRRIAGREISYSIPRPVRMRMRQPEQITVAECAAKYRRVTGVDARPGPWRNDLMPHTVRPMNLFQEPWIKEIWLCWPERTAKTNVMLNCLAAIHKCFSTGNVFWLEPSDDYAGNNVKTKIIPMFRESPKLKKYLSLRADDTGKKLIAFSKGSYLFPASSNSARTMSNFFGKYNFGNEVDKYPALVGTETDPIKLIRKRGRDVRGSKFMFGSTPAGKYIYKGTMNCRQVWEYHNRCPHCNELILMDDQHLDIPAGATPEAVESGDVAVHYACNACAALWNNHDREWSFYNGDWVIVKGAEDAKPRTVGIHASAFPFPMIPLEEIAGKYLRSKNGDQSDKIDYAHGYLVVDYKDELSDRKEDGILALVDPSLPTGFIPDNTSTIIVKADTQQTGFFYQVIACGYGENFTIDLIDHGFVENFEALKEIEGREYQDVAGKLYQAHAGVIDSGGGTNPFKPKHSRTAEVYEFCRINKFWLPIKGRRNLATPWNITRIDNYPTRDGKKKPIPGGLKLYMLNVTHYKNQLASRLNITPGDPGAIRLHAGISADGPLSGSKYAAQLCAEHQDSSGYWENQNNKPNHFWDCWVYGFAAADILGVRRKKQPDSNHSPTTSKRRIYSEGV